MGRVVLLEAGLKLTFEAFPRGSLMKKVGFAVYSGEAGPINP